MNRMAYMTPFLAMLAANVIAPVVILPALVILFGFTRGDPSMALSVLPFIPTMMVTREGMFVYGIGFVASLVLGSALTAAAVEFPFLRGKLVWVAVGAVGGMLIGLRIASAPEFALLGAAAGASCAFVYRAIMEWPLRELQGPDT